MKIIRKINKFALIVTLILYLTYFLGLIAQVLLGAIQIIIAIIISIKFFKICTYARVRLCFYWIFVVFEFLTIYLEQNHFETSNDFYEILIYVIFPMSIAIYFTLILNKIIRNHENS